MRMPIKDDKPCFDFQAHHFCGQTRSPDSIGRHDQVTEGQLLSLFRFHATNLRWAAFLFHKVFALVVACYGPILNSLLISSMQ